MMLPLRICLNGPSKSKQISTDVGKLFLKTFDWRFSHLWYDARDACMLFLIAPKYSGMLEKRLERAW